MIVAGCENDDEYEVISLEYIKCPCNSEKSITTEIIKENILLFDANKTSIPEMQELTLNGQKAEYICYYPEKDSALYCDFNNINIAYNNIVSYLCNFPEISKEWVIPFKGIYVSFSADVYEACNGYPAVAFNSYTENVLTSFKKRIK
jgi:hypothetical protein